MKKEKNGTGDREDDNPERLISRIKSPEYLDYQQSKTGWRPAQFYKEHPDLKIRALIFDPIGPNDKLLSELQTRARAFGAKKPFLVTDVLFLPEAERVVEDVLPVLQKLDEIANEPAEMAKWGLVEALHEYHQGVVEDDVQVQKAEKYLGQTGDRPNDANHQCALTSEQLDRAKIARLLSPEKLKSIQKVAQEPHKLSEAIVDFVLEYKRDKTKKLTASSHSVDDIAKEIAQERAQELWEDDPHVPKISETGTSVAQLIQQELQNEYKKTYSLTTIEKWIAPCVPAARKKGGRPRKTQGTQKPN